MQEHALGVDLGTSNTVAVLRWPDGRTRPLLFDGQPIMPSGVLLDDEGRLHVGRDAQRLAQADPGRYEPNPKRRIDEPTVLLGDRELQTVDLLAALLAAVAHAAVEAVGHLPPAALTHPAAWGTRRRELVAAAVVRAGWPPVGPDGRGTKLVPEPVAAARYFSQVLRRPVPDGRALAVFDFGGGTLDVAIVRNQGGAFSVIGTGGVAELGGLDLDAALIDHLGQIIRSSDPAAWQRLLHPQGAMQLRDRRRFWDDVRGAKEMLSRAAVAPVAVPGVEQHIHLTREELERVVTPLLQRGVYATGSVIAQSGLRPDQLAGLFLVGGSSRVPMVARLLHSELGIAPTVLEQPELPVAEGALAELDAGRPVSPAPTSPAPASLSPAGPPPAAPPPASPRVTAFASVPAGGHVSAPPFGAPPAEARRRWLVPAVAAAVVLVIAAVAGAVYLLRPDGYEGVEFRAFADVGQPVEMKQKTTPTYTWTQLLGDRAYFAFHREDDRLEVIGAETSTGKELWRVQTPDPFDTWGGITAVPGAVLAFPDVYTTDKPYQITILDAENGERLWSLPAFREDGVRYADGRLVHVDRAQDRLVGYDLRTGKKEWEQKTPRDQYDYATTSVYTVTTPGDLAGPADIAGNLFAPVEDDDQRLVQVSSDLSARVIDAGNGKILRSRPNVADADDPAYAHDGRFVVATEAGVFSYDLESLGQPDNIYSTVDRNHKVTELAPCGENRVCLLESTSLDADTTELVAVDSAKGEVIWRKPAAAMTRLVPVGEYALLSSNSPENVALLFDPDGTQVERQAGVAMRVNGGSVLFLSRGLSTFPEDPSVAGMDVGASDPTQLGPLTDVRTSSCSIDTEMIACAADSTFVIRRFADA
jgi:outer membrane protein assembly factor BamB/Ethanolamine utilization protein EutJ (predicted chaperonin)